MKSPFIAFLLASALPLTGATVFFDLQGSGGAGLLTTNEVHSPTGSGTGGEVGGGISYDDVTNKLIINVGWGSGQGFSDLTGNATAAHLHGPTASSGAAAFNENAGVPAGFGLTIDNASGSNGSILDHELTLTETQEAELLAGRYYINVHTSANGAGEIRGNLVQVPEPTVAALGALGLLGLLRRRR